tara:strand:+ start:126 stop:404 length:279 start_codon:yes stop_codon:yes gene_type:complete
MAERVVPNKCYKTRGEVGGRAYRIVSFFHAHPSEVGEDVWTSFAYEGQTLLVDKLTMAVMAECQCEFLTREVDADSDEPTIVAVKLTEKKKV